MVLNMVSCGNMHGNNMQMRLCAVKLGVVSSIYGDFWEESGWRDARTNNLSLTGIYKEDVTGLERHAHGWVINDIIFGFGWTNPLRLILIMVNAHFIHKKKWSKIINVLTEYLGLHTSWSSSHRDESPRRENYIRLTHREWRLGFPSHMNTHSWKIRRKPLVSNLTSIISGVCAAVVRKTDWSWLQS